MSEKLCLVPFCDVCGRMIHEAIGYRIEWKDYCLECAGKCLNRHDCAEPVCASMTDNQIAYEKAICEIAGVKDIGEVSDGFHTFNQLYHQRAILFATIVNAYKGMAWKTWRHEDGELCFGGGWFLVTIDTPSGAYGYHYEAKYWELFDCAEIDKAKHWDGYTESDVMRLMSLEEE